MEDLVFPAAAIYEKARVAMVEAGKKVVAEECAKVVAEIQRPDSDFRKRAAEAVKETFRARIKALLQDPAVLDVIRAKLAEGQVTSAIARELAKAMSGL